MEETEASQSAPAPTAIRQPQKLGDESEPETPVAVGLLKAFAWLNLIGGVILGFWIFPAMGQRPAGIQSAFTEELNKLKVEGGSVLGEASTRDLALKLAQIEIQGKTEVNPMGIGLGFGLIAEGFFGYVFLLVVADMAQNLVAIRGVLQSRPDHSSPSQHDADSAS